MRVLQSAGGTCASECGNRVTLKVEVGAWAFLLCEECAARLHALLPEPIDHAAEVERLTHEVSVMAHALEYPAEGVDRQVFVSRMRALLDEIDGHLEAM